MGKEIHLTDYGRILLGKVPWTFAIEVLLRVTLAYAMLVVAMRLMGKRMSSQLTRNEMLAMVSLAAAMGPSLQSPDRGILPAMVTIAIVILIQRFIGKNTFRSAEFEQATQGDISVLVRDGEMDLPVMKSVPMPREQLVAQLRSQGIESLGQVQRFYLETDGAFTLLRFDKPRPGLSLIPSWDIEFVDSQPRAQGKAACSSCGHVEDAAPARSQPCRRCNHDAWQQAVQA